MSLRLTEQEYQTFLALRKPKVREKAAREMATPTDATRRLLRAILDDETIPGYWCREFTFDDVRDFRIDVAAPLEKLGVECDGGVHRIKKNFLRDLTKHNLLTLAGWRYIRVTPSQVDNGEALVLIKALLAQERRAA